MLCLDRRRAKRDELVDDAIVVGLRGGVRGVHAQPLRSPQAAAVLPAGDGRRVDDLVERVLLHALDGQAARYCVDVHAANVPEPEVEAERPGVGRDRLHRAAREALGRRHGPAPAVEVLQPGAARVHRVAPAPVDNKIRVSRGAQRRGGKQARELRHRRRIDVVWLVAHEGVEPCRRGRRENELAASERRAGGERGGGAARGHVRPGASVCVCRRWRRAGVARARAGPCGRLLSVSVGKTAS